MARKILIVDNSATMRRIISGMILSGLSDAEIAEARNAYEAWEQLRNQEFHLMLFSWEPSGTAWLNFFMRLGQRPAERRLSSIILTSGADQPHVREALNAGVSGKLVIPCTQIDLTNIINQVCNPLTLRHTSRYSLPDTTALLQQEGRSYQAAVINVSKGGLLCELEYMEDYKWAAPVTITITFRMDGKQFAAKGLFSLLSRFIIVETNADHSPKKVRVAYRFSKVPPAVQGVLDDVFGVAEELEKLLSSQSIN
jgi:CheY-like chemotaxis protein